MDWPKKSPNWWQVVFNVASMCETLWQNFFWMFVFCAYDRLCISHFGCESEWRIMPEIYLFFWSICTAAPSTQVGVCSCFSSFVINRNTFFHKKLLCFLIFPCFRFGATNWYQRLFSSQYVFMPLQNNNNNVVLMTISVTLNL